jgi:hypothetical protein
MLPNAMNCTILNIRSPIANLHIIRPTINWYHSPLSLEDTLKTFMQLTREAIIDIKNATMVNT